MAKKIKVKIKIKHIYIPIPAVPLSMAAWIMNFALKHSSPETTDSSFCPEEINSMINTFKELKPFKLADINVVDQGRKISIQIYTK